jgi:hypothetical protein
MLRFGATEDLPAGTDTAWGARATITPTGAIHLPPDHTDLVGPRAAQLTDHLVGHVGAVWRDQASELVRLGVMHPGQAGRFVLYRDSTVVIIARTRASDNDLHVCAYLTTPHSA